MREIDAEHQGVNILSDIDIVHGPKNANFWSSDMNGVCFMTNLMLENSLTTSEIGKK